MTELDLFGCERITTLPKLPSGLTMLDLSRCFKLTDLPELPSSLTTLNLPGCHRLNALPELPSGFATLNLSFCKGLTDLPEFPSGLSTLILSSLDHLKTVYELPSGLKSLDLSGCLSLKDLPELPASLTSLNLSRCLILTELPELPSVLTTINLSECKGLTELPELPSGLTELNLMSCISLTKLPKLPSGLRGLNLLICSNITELPELPSGLTVLKLKWCEGLNELPELPSTLTELDLSLCKGLTVLPELPSSLTSLGLSDCESLSDEVKITVLSKLLDQDFFQGLKLAIGFDIEDKARFIELIFPRLEQKMADPSTSPDKLLKLANYIYFNHVSLGLHDEHPLMQEAINIVAINEQPGLKNPFSLFKELKDRFQLASEFTPEKMGVEGVDVRVNMDQLKAMSDALKIKRADLPGVVTLESFDTLFNGLKNKVVSGGEVANEALNALGTSLADVEMPILGDPTQFLIGLLKLEGENVSEVEAKWRAVLWNIMEKDTTKRDDHFFTEQEEVFIKTMMGIQNCEGGKAAGIASSYEQLDSKYRYKLKLSGALSVMEAETEDKKLKGLAFVKEFASNQPSNSPANVLAENLIAYVNEERDRSINITPWLEDESFWDEDTFELNKAGALELLKITKREEAKTLFSQVIGEAVQKLVASQFSGTNPLMEELIGTNAINQGSHQAIYLKNLIGHLVGVSQAVTFDRHTGVLYDNLINKSREEVLSIFFKYVSPKVLVNEVLRTFKEPSNETNEALKSFLPEDKYWDENGALNKLGALELLVTLNYVT